MKKKELKTVETFKYLCDICDEHIVQDGKDISLIPDPERNVDYVFHFHTTCLVNHLKKAFLPQTK